MGVIFLFIDGVGLGKKDSSNPFTQKSYPGFKMMTGGQSFTLNTQELAEATHIFRHADARLGVEGLPQSGTGQAALFSGENAPKQIGKHFGPFPHSGIKHLLTEQSLFSKTQRMGKKAQFVNAYPDVFFQKAKKSNRWSCTTLMTKSANIKLNTIKEVKKQTALTAEITQQAWREHLNIDVPQISAETAAERLLGESIKFDLLLHEYYLTDKAGHSKEVEKAERFLEIYDRFLTYLIQHKKKHMTIVLSSDHGNIEDLSIKTHTFNKVPLFAQGPGAKHFANTKSIMDVTPGILEVLKEEG